jgi:hypothetical protein
MRIQTYKDTPPFLLFVPFLFLYIVYVRHFHTDQMLGDEARYYQFAENLLHGFYSPVFPNIDLINGPGYPIILMPFVLFKLPLLSITLFNALLHYLSIILVFKSIQLITNAFKVSFIIGICWGAYFLAYQEMACILTESYTLFLISAFSYLILDIQHQKNVRLGSILMAGICLGMLILTKVLFAYVLILLVIIVTTYYFRNKKSTAILKPMLVLLISFSTITPYLIYTYSITGKLFYLSTEGGKVLYWMTSLNEEEFGDWNNNNFDANCSNKSFCNASFIAKNHQVDIDKILKTKTVIEADSLFKGMAIANIKSNPVKYIKNWFANIGRLLFGFPASYYLQSPTTLVRIYINSIVLLAMVYSLLVFLCNWKTVPIEMIILIAFTLIYLGLSSLFSAYPRQFTVIVPTILIWTTYAIRKSVKINLKIESNP